MTLFLSTAFLIAGMLIFLITHIFYEISAYQNSALAYAVLIALTVLFAYLIFLIAREIFSRAIKKQEKKVKAGLLGQILGGFTGKAVIGVIFIEILRIILIKFRHKQEKKLAQAK